VLLEATKINYHTRYPLYLMGISKNIKILWTVGKGCESLWNGVFSKTEFDDFPAYSVSIFNKRWWWL